ncbi:tyrosine-type recombinase/integrase [Paenibacillus alvei]
MDPEEKPYWYILNSKIDHEILKLTDSLGHNMWDAVDPSIIDYINRNCLNFPWSNHIALIAVVRTSFRKYVPSSIKAVIKGLNARFKVLFPVLGISSMNDWNIDHLTNYINKVVLPEHTDNQRYTFLKMYEPASDMINRFYENKLNVEQKAKLKKYIIPRLYENFFDQLGKKVISQQKANRKKETDAIVPYYAKLRGEAHFRWNLVSRLKNKYNEVLKNRIKYNNNFPIPFHFEENNQYKHYFIIWDRRTYIFEHQEHYSNKTIKNAKEGVLGFSEESNEKFLEYVKTTDINNETIEDHPYWFLELFRNGMFGNSPNSSKNQERAKIDTYFLSHGYGDICKQESFKSPFRTKDIGLMRYGKFMKNAQQISNGTLFNMESVYACCTFALAALEIFTTTGARINELRQISASKECMVVLREEPHPHSTHTEPIKRKLLRLVPKGRTELENYFIGEEAARCLNQIVQLLKETYNESIIPEISFTGDRSYLFKENKPYIFQYNRKHLSSQSLTASLRFLLHGIYFKTDEGIPILMKPHLLRHAFATHAVQVEKIPIDIVREWMHQKNVEVTEYYSAPTTAQLAANADIWLTSIASHINVGHAVKRSPSEIRDLYNDAKDKVGALTNVIGGSCSTDAFCPVKFACVGCAAKIPEPEKKEQIIFQLEWAIKNRETYTKMELYQEAYKMSELIRNCRKELEEIDSIERYREDEQFDPKVIIE